MSRCENEDPNCCEALVEPARTDVATKTKVIRATERIPKARTYVLRDRVLIHHAFYRLRGKRSRQFCGFFEVICQMLPYKHPRREFPENPLLCAAICKHPPSSVCDFGQPPSGGCPTAIVAA